ncbi:hypothetical protein DV736_g3180, partial [Chaetothyriales sp. CBS 134916]
MATLSQDDRDLIVRHPLDNSLHHLEKSLRDAERSYTSASSLRGDATDDSEDGRQKAISRLLTALMGQETALDLHSRVSNRNVASELATLLGRFRQGQVSYAHCLPLVRLVIQKASDFDIWSAVLDLITTLSRVTPPASIPTAFDDTPITHSSASQQGAEQTRELVKKRLFEEIRSCTYREVGGVIQKYFEAKSWTPRTLDIYQAMKTRHKNGRWTDFPDPPVQAEVLDWWFRFQKEFLSQERGLYYTTTSPKDLVGAEAQRQIDLFVKPSDSQTSDTAHDWKDVRVIGELKESNRDKKGTLLQISRYVRDVFSCQPTRRYVHAFTICGREMEAWVFDRSGPYSPGPFDIHDEPERFIQVIAGYCMMNEEELGLDTFTERDVDGCFVTLEQDGAESPTKMRLEPLPITHQRAIVCRGTSCFLTRTPGSKGHDCVTKFSWTSDRRRPEADLLRLARQRGVKGIANLIAHRRITDIAELRSGLTFGEPYSFRGLSSAASSFSQSFSQSQQPSFLSGSFSELHGLSIAQNPPRKRKSYDVEEAQGTSLLTSNSGPYDNRIFRSLIVSPAGRAIHNYESPLELLEALRDAIKAHESLYRKGNILHRDISENNIIITDPKTDGFKGMLIDLDLAKELGSGRSGARCRTGTMEFMAIEVLQGISHTYRHDLESFFYVLIWQCGRRGWKFLHSSKEQPAPSLLTKWYIGTYREIASAKRGHMHVDGFEDILVKYVWDTICEQQTADFCSKVIAPGGKLGAIGGVEPPRDDITITRTLGYTATGETVKKPWATFPEEITKAHYEWIKKWADLVDELLAEGKIKPHPPKVRKGLENVIEGMDEMKEGKTLSQTMPTEAEFQAAERALENYLKNRRRPTSPSPRTPDISWHSNVADVLERQLQEDNHRTWGFVIYRTTYDNDEDWVEFLKRLRIRMEEEFDRFHGRDILELFTLTVIEDREHIDGASTAAIQEHFRQWRMTAPQSEQQQDNTASEVGPGLSPRYRYAIEVDTAALHSVVYDAPAPPDLDTTKLGWVKLIDVSWEPASPESIGNFFEPIEGVVQENSLEV